MKLHKTFKIRYKQNKDWDPPIPINPIGLFLHPMGANRAERRANREHKHDPMPPGSMVPAVKRLNQKTQKVEYAPER